MDYHSLKRKELQSLCKKNNLPANLTNFEMADRLTSLSKGKDELLTGKKSSMKTFDVNGSENEPDVEKKRVKKVRFSPETQMFEFKKADAKKLEKNRPGRQKAVTKEISILENVDVLELSEGIGDVQRTRRQGKRDVKDDALGHNLPTYDAHNGPDRVLTRRSLRIREVVDEKKGKNEDKENVMKKKGSKRQGNVKESDIDDIFERGEGDVEFVEAQAEKGLRRSKRNVKNVVDCKLLNNEMVTRRSLRKVAMEVREGSCPSGLEIDAGKGEKEGFLGTSDDLVFNCEKKTRKRRRDPVVEEEAVKIDSITVDLTVEGSSHSANRREKALGKVSQKGKRRSKKQTEEIEVSVNEVLTSKELPDIAVVDNLKQQRKSSRKNTGRKSRSKDQDSLMGINGEITASDSADLKMDELEPGTDQTEAAEQEDLKRIEIQVQLPVCKPTLSGPASPDHIVEDERISSETNAANSEDAMTTLVSVDEELTAKGLLDIDFAESNVSKDSDNEGFVDNLKQQRKRRRKNSGRKSHPKDQDSCLTGVNGENTASHSTDLKIDDIEPGTETFHNQTVATEQEGCGDVVSSEKLSMEDLKGTDIWIELPICKPTLSGLASLDHVVEDDQISSEKNAANSEDAMSAIVFGYENLQKVSNPDNNDYPSSSLSSGSAFDQMDPSPSMLAKRCEADTVAEQGNSDHEELKCNESAKSDEHNHTKKNCPASDKCCENTIIEPSSTAPHMLEDGNVNGGEDSKDPVEMLGKDLCSPLRAANAMEANCTQLESTTIPIDSILTLEDSDFGAVSGTIVKSRQSFFRDTMVEIQERSVDEMERHLEPTKSDDLTKEEKQSGVSQDLVLAAQDFSQQTTEDEANSSMNLEMGIEEKEQSPFRRQNGCEASNVAEVDRNYVQVELKCDELSKSADYRSLAEQCHTHEESFIPVSPKRSAGSMLPDEFVDPEDSAKHLKNAAGSKKMHEDELDKDGNDGFIQSYTSAEKEHYYEDNPVNSKTGNVLDVYDEEFTSSMNLDILLEKGEHSLIVHKNDSEADGVVEVDQNDGQVELNHNGLPESVKDTPVEESYQSPNKCSESSVRSILQDGEDSMECQKSTIKSRKTFEDEPGKDGNTGFTHSCITQKYILAENYDNCEEVPVNAKDPMEAMITRSGDFANIPLVDKNDMAPDQRKQSPIQQMNGIDAVNVAEEDRGHEELKCTDSADEQNPTNENCGASDKCCESDDIEPSTTLTCMLEEGNVNGGEDSKDPAGFLGKGFVSPLRAANATETNSLSSGSADLDKDEDDGFIQSNTYAEREYYCEENPLNSRTGNFLDVYNEEFTSSMNLDISLEQAEHSLIVHKNGSEAGSVGKVRGNDDQVEPKYDGLSEFVKDTPVEENYESPNKCSESSGRRTLQDGEDSMECQKNTITFKKTYEDEHRKYGNTGFTNSCITEKFILAENYDNCEDVPVNAEDPMEPVIFETDKFANIPLVDNNNDMAPDQREESPIQQMNGVDAVNVNEEDRGHGQVELYCDESAKFVEDRCLEERHHSPYKCLASIVSDSSGRTSRKTLKVEIVSNSEVSIKHLEESYEDAPEEDGGASSIESYVIETYTASQNHEDSLNNSMNAMEAIISTAENIAHIPVADNKDESTNSLNLDVMIEEREKSSLMHRNGCQTSSVEYDELDKDENDGFIQTDTSAKKENCCEDNPMNSRTGNFRDVYNEYLSSSMKLDISSEKGEHSLTVGSEAGSKFILTENCDCEEVPVDAEGQMEAVICGTVGFANIPLVDNNDMAPDQREESPILQMNGFDSVNVAEEDRDDGQGELYCDESAELVEDRCLEERRHSPNKCLTSIVSDSSGRRSSRILLDKIVSGSEDSIKHREKSYNDAPEEDGGAGSVESYVIDKYTTTNNHEDISSMVSEITLKQKEQSPAVQKHGWENDNVAEEGNCEDKELGCDKFTKSVEDRPFTEINCSSTEFSANICNIRITNLLDCNPTTDDPEEIVDATEQLPSAPKNSFGTHDVSGACKNSEDAKISVDVANFEHGNNVEDVVDATKSKEVVVDVQSCREFEPLIEESKNAAIEIKNSDVMADEKTFLDESEMAKRNRCRSILIHGTPRKLEIAAAADMKENMVNSKMEKLGSLTTVKPATKRPALKDLVQK